MLDPLEGCIRAIDQTGNVVRAVRPDQMNLPTPCTDWNVRQLLTHMVGGNYRFAALADGKPLERSDPGEDVLGDDPYAAYAQSAQLMKNAWSKPGRIEQTYDLPFGKLPGSFALGMRIQEYLAHGWDLGKAIGQPAHYDEDLVEEALRLSRQTLQERPPGLPFGPAREAPAGASRLDELAAFMGRGV